MCIESLDERLRGQQNQEIAIRVLTESRFADRPVHYKEWYGLFREAGYSVGGKEPVASFLASISRSPKVRGIGKRSGLYVLIGHNEEERGGARERGQSPRSPPDSGRGSRSSFSPSDRPRILSTSRA